MNIKTKLKEFMSATFASAADLDMVVQPMSVNKDTRGKLKVGSHEKGRPVHGMKTKKSRAYTRLTKRILLHT